MVSHSNRLLEAREEDRFWFVSKAKSMVRVNEILTQLRRETMEGSKKESPVLILGEKGTGKEGIGRMIHAGSCVAQGPWIAVHGFELGRQLSELDLFGEGLKDGSIRNGIFDCAQDGTLFIQEIGEMDLRIQEKLAHILREKHFKRINGTENSAWKVRLIATTSQDLRAKIKEGSFREDLFQLLSQVTLNVPPLRERVEDIIPLAVKFSEYFFKIYLKSFEGFTADAEKILSHYHWEGNVRELYNVIERVALTWNGRGLISGAALSILDQQSYRKNGSSNGPGLKLVSSTSELSHMGSQASYTELKKKWCDSFEREYLVSVLNRNAGNVSASARESKLDRSNFLRLLRRHGLRASGYRKAA